MKALQDKNRVLTEDSVSFKTRLDEAAAKCKLLEDKYAKDKDRWHKELLASMSHGSEREQQLKTQIDALQRELATLKAEKARSEQAGARQAAESRAAQAQLESARDKILGLQDELDRTREEYEERLRKACEVGDRLEAKVREFELKRENLQAELAKASIVCVTANRRWRRKGNWSRTDSCRAASKSS